ncbi:MAG: Na(+)/H(+) antiporter subunit C [Nesterenkonia sp.]|uniref:Na(+)/H(+) antiporter subunit C n=1 Tax=Nesterenkonia marinintestina TaxID=2979865 RepID=UPI0021BFE7E2|nr:Na(+)/H(+) antiporter subunit C [Nesterenkonia sp. GX14115]MDO5493105.1 Na(+)/H(+) antiporter subunit C [Nesterenkonia sp.]
MTVNLTLVLVMGVMLATGVYMVLERSLTRVVLGVILISNGANLMILMSGGRAGEAPLVRDYLSSEDYFDPLPQALLLTAIVIAFALVAFMLALVYRSWVIGRQDEVVDDPEDRRVAAQPVYDPEEDSEIPTETTEFDGGGGAPTEEAAEPAPDSRRARRERREGRD